MEPPYIFGASARGEHHVRKNLPCQDSCGYKVLSSSSGILAVADGLGSVPRSHIGSAAAVQAVIDWAKNSFDSLQFQTVDLQQLAGQAVRQARARLEEKAAEETCLPGDLGCTLIVVVFCEDKVCVAHVGDGCVVARTGEGLKLLSGPGDSEYVNEVIPLTSLEYEKYIRVSNQCSGVTAVAAFTDGCQRAALLKSEDALNPYEKFFDPLFSYAEQISGADQGSQDVLGFLASSKMSQTSDDDKTLVVAILGKG